MGGGGGGLDSTLLAAIRVALVLKSEFTTTCQCNSVWKYMNKILVPWKCILMLHIALLFIIVSLIRDT